MTAENPNGKPNESGMILARISLSKRNVLASHSPRDKYSWLSWPPMATAGTMGTPAFSAAFTYPTRPPKSILFSTRVGRYTS